jgi:hypothetical protein
MLGAGHEGAGPPEDGTHARDIRLLAPESGQAIWGTRAASARNFIASMWNPGAGRFNLGTATDGVTTNDATQAEDVNSWSYLALQSPAYAASVDWGVQNLAVTAGPFSGVSIGPGDRTGARRTSTGLSYCLSRWTGGGAPTCGPQGAMGRGPAGLARLCGPAEGPFADAPMAALVLPITREALHHGAEIASFATCTPTADHPGARA